MQTIDSISDARDMSPRYLRSLMAPDPHRSGDHRWRLREDDLPVWAVILHLQTIEADLNDVSDAAIAESATAFSISPVSVLAAIAYYRDNQASIDALLLMNEVAVS